MRSWGAVAVAATALLAGCGADTVSSSPDTAEDVDLDAAPSEEQARELLKAAHEFAAAEDLDALCQMSTAPENCHRILDIAGTPPQEPPTIVGTRVVSPERSDSGTVAAVRVLEVCAGGHFTEVMVLNWGGEVELMTPVYWSGFDASASELNGDGSAGAVVTAGSAESACDT